MKNFLEFITEARTSQASAQAKKLGFSGDGHGYWVDKEGKKRAQTIKGKLQFLDDKKRKSEKEEDPDRQEPAKIKAKKLGKAKPAPKRTGAKAKSPTSERTKKPEQKSGAKAKGAEQQAGPSADVVTVAIGKFNPPTKSHLNLFNSLKKSASGGNFYIFPSRTKDGKKNPLDPDLKVEFMKAMFPEYADNIIDSEEFKTIFDVLTFLNQEGYTGVNIVCGAERVSEIENLAKKQNGQIYNYSSMNVMSAGPKDSDDGSQEARVAAAAGDFEAFKKTMPQGVQPKIVKKLYDQLGGSLEVKETWQIAPELDPQGLREHYVFDKLFQVGDIVESCNTGLRGEIIRSGANHLICVTEDGIMFKSWIKDVTLV